MDTVCSELTKISGTLENRLKQIGQIINNFEKQNKLFQKKNYISVHMEEK
jgi:hypothetical protein